MLSVHKITNSEKAAHYHSQKDDYYSKDSSASTRWSGEGAKRLGLVNGSEVDLEEFNNLLAGKIDAKTQIGGESHMPGYDLTFSAPKSVSVLGLAGGDSRVIEAHEKAVAKTLRKIEQEFIKTRVKDGAGNVSVRDTASMIAAQFRHETSREAEAQLHSHCVIMNMTYDEVSDQYRSLDGRAILNDGFIKSMGQEYRSTLAEEIQRLGYNIRTTEIGKDGFGFEIEGINEEYLHYMSSRSQQVEAYLQTKGLTRETATAAQKQEAVLATRKSKGSQDHDNLKHKWNADALAHGVELSHLISQSKANEDEYSQAFDIKAAKFAKSSVAFAISKLEERSSSFTRKELIDEAKKYAQLNSNEQSIIDAIDAAELAQDIQFKYMQAWNYEKAAMEDMPAYASKLNIQTELKMLEHAQSLSSKGTQLLKHEAALQLVNSISENEKTEGRYAFNQQQIDAAANILSSKSSMNLLQGLAGTSKTNSVLLTLSNEYKKHGYEVIGLAPTGAAAATLSDALNIEGRTLASYLKSKQDLRSGPGRVVILDEASLAGSVDMAELLKVTDKFNDKVILTGDTNQLSSVSAGNAFRMLQEAGYQTEKLELIVRQTNEELLQAVYDAKDGKAAESLANLPMIESEKAMDRLRMMRDSYISLTADERLKTLMLVTGKEDLDQLNKLVRDELIERNELGDDAITFDVLRKRDITETESREARFYRETDYIEFNKNYTKISVNEGEVAQVVAKDSTKNTITVRFDGGRQVTFNPKQLTKYSVFEKEQIELRAGDKIMRNGATKDLSEKNGNEFDVLEVNAEHQTVTIREGKQIKVVGAKDLKKIQHNYVMTSFPAQGKTYQRVYAHAESHRVNLMNKTTFYVQLSRAKSEVVIFTDSKSALTKALNQRSGKKYTALEGLQKNDLSSNKQEVTYNKENKDAEKNEDLLIAKTHREFTLIQNLNKAERAYIDKSSEIQKMESSLRALKRDNESKLIKLQIAERKEKDANREENLRGIQHHLDIGYINAEQAQKQRLEVFNESKKPLTARKSAADSLQETAFKVRIEKEKLKLKGMGVALSYSKEHREAREIIANAKNEKVIHAAPSFFDSSTDKYEKDGEKIKTLNKAEYDLEQQKRKIYQLANTAANDKDTPSLRGLNKARDPFKRLAFNMKNMQHNARVVKTMAVKTVRTFKLVYNVQKLNFMEMRIKYSGIMKEAKKLREEAARARWDRNAAETIKKYNDSVKPKVERKNDLTTPESNVKSAQRVEKSLSEMLLKQKAEVINTSAGRKNTPEM